MERVRAPPPGNALAGRARHQRTAEAAGPGGGNGYRLSPSPLPGSARPRRIPRPETALLLDVSRSLLVALQRVAHEKPEILTPHLDDLVRHATSTDLPHAQIRELARRAALALASPADPRTDTIRYANRPASCLIDRDQRERIDRRLSQEHRYRFDEMDTIPYWYAPLARVFGIPVDTVAESAERWILDTWGLDENDWWTDARELREGADRGTNEHGHGSIPPEKASSSTSNTTQRRPPPGELTD